MYFLSLKLSYVINSLVNVKWNKQVFNNIDLNTDEEPRLFKAQLYAITSVAIDRQKVLYKGKQIQDDSWTNLAIKDGVTLLLMGSQEHIPTAPQQKTLFVEDLNENKLVELLNLPAGLDNLGNTCYINATLQCLKTVPEFCKKLKQFELNDINVNSLLIQAIKNLYTQMNKNAVGETNFLVSTLMNAVPRFAENQQNNQFQQQDANEFWTELLRLLRNELKPIENATAGDGSEIPLKYESFVDQYFGGTFEAILKNTETDDEETTKSNDNFLQLSCFINPDVRYLISGLKAKLEEQLTKHSPKLDRDAVYQKSSKISRLPSYLSVQMVRYIYKERESINAKILKDIKFSISLDVFELCTSELQDKLMPMRTKFKEQDDKLSESKVNQGDQEKEEENNKKEDDQIYTHPTYFKDDLGSNNSGLYELQAVLTHKGRSSSSGHYVAWIKRNKSKFFFFNLIVRVSLY